MSDIRASMQDPFDKLMYEAIDSIHFDEEAARRIWGRIETEAAQHEEPRVATRRNKAIIGVSAVAIAASLCAVAVVATSAFQPGVVSPSSQAAASSGPNSGGGVASAAASATTQAQDSPDNWHFFSSDHRWSIAVSDDITLISRTDPDGHSIPTKEGTPTDYMGTFIAIDSDSGANTTCEVYRVLDSDELYSVRFKDEGALYDAIVAGAEAPMHLVG